MTVQASRAGTTSAGEWTLSGQTRDLESGNHLAETFSRVDRSTAWALTGTRRLTFPTFHTQGLALTPNHIFLSAVEVIEPPTAHPLRSRSDCRTAGYGVGHLFVLDLAGQLQRDILLGEGDRYHPGGIDFDGHDVWVPVAEYRPHSGAIVYRVDAITLQHTEQFHVPDHIGSLVMDRRRNRLVGTTWGSRQFIECDPDGSQRRTWANPCFLLDYQDGQYVADSTMLCAGVTSLPQTPAAGGASATYELGGIALIDITGQKALHQVPFPLWSTSGHVATRNPFAMTAGGDHLTVFVAPDDGDEGSGTEILTYEARVTSSPTTRRRASDR